MHARKMYPQLLFTLLIFTSAFASAQSKCDCFNRLYHLSTYYRDRNDTANAISSLRDAISFLDENAREDYYWALAEMYGAYGQLDSSVAYYTKAVTNSGGGLNIVKRDAPVVFAKMDTLGITRSIATQRSNADLDYYNQFISGYAIDQALRGDLVPWSEMSDTTASVKKLVNNLFYRSDSINFELVKSTLEKYGYPTFHKLGFPPDHFFIFILHITIYENGWSDYIFNKLAALNAECDFPEKSRLLFLMDRQKSMRGKKSITGLAGGPIEDIRKADSIRFSYNHLRIKESAVVSRQKLPAEYKPLPYPANYFCLKKYQIK